MGNINLGQGLTSAATAFVTFARSYSAGVNAGQFSSDRSAVEHFVALGKPLDFVSCGIVQDGSETNWGWLHQGTAQLHLESPPLDLPGALHLTALDNGSRIPSPLQVMTDTQIGTYVTDPSHIDGLHFVLQSAQLFI